MTECTGRRYWQARIAECIHREVARFGARVRRSSEMPVADLQRLTDWHLARVGYLKKVKRWGRSIA